MMTDGNAHTRQTLKIITGAGCFIRRAMLGRADLTPPLRGTMFRPLLGQARDMLRWAEFRNKGLDLHGNR